MDALREQYQDHSLPEGDIQFIDYVLQIHSCELDDIQVQIDELGRENIAISAEHAAIRRSTKPIYQYVVQNNKSSLTIYMENMWNKFIDFLSSLCGNISHRR